MRGENTLDWCTVDELKAKVTYYTIKQAKHLRQWTSSELTT
jgi:hypothetical protein